MWGAVGFFPDFNDISQYIITLGIKHGQNININSRKTGFITFHQ
jgi:hypothetical protein